MKILNEKREADRKKTSTTPTQVQLIEKPMCQMGHVSQGTPRPSIRTPRIIRQEALIAFSLESVGIKRIHPITKNNQDYKNKTFGEIHSQKNLQHFCAPVIHPTTDEIMTSYKRLKNDPKFREVWETGFGKEWGGLAQGDKRTGSKGTNTLIILRPDQVNMIPNDRVVTYANIVVDYLPQK